MLRILFIFFVLVGPALARDVWTDPHPGVRLLHRTTAGPHRMFAAVIDLTRPGVRVRATRTEDRQNVTSRFARDYGVQVAINGDFYNGERTPSGLAVGDGAQWPGTRDTGTEGFIALGRDNRALISAPAAVVDPPEAWMDAVVSGRPLVVRAGAAVDPPDCAPHFCDRHPRTAVGLDEAGETLFLLVVDGRTAGAIGMTTREVGEVLAGLGAHTGLNLDGGGSSTLFVAGAGGVVNTPSDGAERAVANHLGVRVGDPMAEPVGELIGFVRAGDVFEGPNLVGAQVTLSDGQAAATGADGLYRFARVAAGPVDITATHPGYAPGERSVVVVAGERTWGSIALVPAAAEPDLGAPPADAAPPERDAAPGDAAPGDAAAVDAAAVDAAPAEAGPRPDAAQAADAVRPDPRPDAARPDGRPDPASLDAGGTPDTTVAAAADQTGGCAQGSGAPLGGPLGLLLAGLGWGLIRRRAGTRRGGSGPWRGAGAPPANMR